MQTTDSAVLSRENLQKEKSLLDSAAGLSFPAMAMKLHC